MFFMLCIIDSIRHLFRNFAASLNVQIATIQLSYPKKAAHRNVSKHLVHALIRMINLCKFGWNTHLRVSMQTSEIAQRSRIGDRQCASKGAWCGQPNPKCCPFVWRNREKRNCPIYNLMLAALQSMRMNFWLCFLLCVSLYLSPEVWCGFIFEIRGWIDARHGHHKTAFTFVCPSAEKSIENGLTMRDDSNRLSS